MINKPSTNVQFTPYEISMCLYDIHRTRQWKQAIEDIVKEGDIVIDAGAGTGILGAFAALDGAKRIHAIELHPRFCELIKHLSEKNNIEKRFNIINDDASKVEIPEKIDVLICELLCTGQFFEPEVQVVNHLRKFFKPTTKVIPQKIESFIQLFDAQETLFGVYIDVDSRSSLLADDEPVSTKELYDTIDLTKHSKTNVDTNIKVRARRNGLCDAVVITGQANLTETIITEPTEFLYNPEVIFLKKAINLIKEHYYNIHIDYEYGCDTLDVKIDVNPV